MASTKKRNRLLGRWPAVGAIAALALTGCASGGGGGGDAGGGDGTGDTIVFQMGSDPSVVNPTMTTGFADQQLGCTVYQGLTGVQEGGTAIPRLAESWELSDDGLEYTFNLVEANWHDGEPFTSADVKFTYENLSTQYGPLWGDVSKVFQGVDTPDDRTAVIKLSEPFAPFVLLTECGHNGAILPKHIFEGVDPQSQEAKEITPIGTGPFTWGEAIPGQSYTLERNNDYWEEGLPKADRLVGQIIADTASAVSAIKAGEIDYINTLGPNAAQQLESVDGIEVEEVNLGTASGQILFFNTKRAPFDNPDVRKALFEAVDRQYLADKVYFGRVKPGVSAIGDAHWSYTGDVDYEKMFPFDVEAAGKALDAAGYPADANGHRFDMNLLLRNDPPERIEMGNVLKAMWSQIGVNVTVTVSERAAENVAAFQEFDFDANIQGYTNYGDPAAGTARAYICDSIGRNFGNPSQYCNPKLDEIFSEAAQVTDQAERSQLYGEADKIIAADLPSIVLLQQGGEFARVSNLKGLVYQDGSPDWSTAYLE